MADPVVSIEGAVELRALLRQMADKGLTKMLRTANKRAAAVVVEKAKPNVPVGKTGQLKASLRATGSQRFGEARAGNSRVVYAAAVHWGKNTGNVNFKHGRKAKTRHAAKANPFLWDAIPPSEAQVVEVYQQDVQALIDQIHTRVV